MPTLFEFNDTNAATFKVYGANWAFQTFTPAVDFTLTAIDLLCFYHEVVDPPGDVTLYLMSSQWNSDTGNQEPNAILATKVETYSDLNEDSETWYRFTLDTPIELTHGTTYAIVLKTVGGTSSNYIGWRISSSDSYGAALVDICGLSDDSGSTWTRGVGSEENYDFAFRLYGTTIEMDSEVIGLVLSPNGNGHYTQLSANRLAIYQVSTDYNWQMVADPLDAPDDIATVVYPNLVQTLTGICTFSDTNLGLVGPVDDEYIIGIGTQFLTELEVGDYIQRAKGGPVLRVHTIESNELVRLDYPHDSDPLQNYGMYGRNPGTWKNNHTLTGELKWKYCGTGTYDYNGVPDYLTGVGGNDFENELIPGDRIRPTGTTGRGYYVGEVISATQLKLRDKWGEHTGTACYPYEQMTQAGAEVSHQGEDEEDMTLMCPATKRDSYIIKSTMSRGAIHGVKVIYRVKPTCNVSRNITWAEENPPPVTAQPFLRYNDIDLLGTEITLTPEMELVSSGSNIMHDVSEWQTRFEYFVTAPGGGAWTWEKINAMEVGIILSMNADVYGWHGTGTYQTIRSIMGCTQLLVVVYQVPAEVPPPDDDTPPGPTPPDYDPDPPPAPIVEPDPITPPAICTPAATRCQGYDLFTCNAAGTAWELTERESETCGFTPYTPDPEDPDPVKCRVSEYGLLAFGDGLGNVVDEYGNVVTGGVSERGYSQEEYWPV